MKVEDGAYGLKVTQQGILKENLGKFKCAVCRMLVHWNLYLRYFQNKKMTLNKKEK